MSTQQADYETVTERPTFTTDRTYTKVKQSFSSKMRELAEGEYLPVPADMDIKSVRTMATRNGPKCDPPRKYSVRKATDGRHYVFWGDEPTEPAIDTEQMIADGTDRHFDAHGEDEGA